MNEILPCPFCGSEIKHVESWAKSFDPPRLYHEWHHVLNNPEECFIRRLVGTIICSASDNTESQQAATKLWNTRPSFAPGREEARELASFGIDRERVWILKFEDADRGDMYFSVEDEAHRAYENYSVSWNCTLLETSQRKYELKCGQLFALISNGTGEATP